MTADVPVMGPAAGNSKPLTPTDPPMFNPEGDLQEFRRDLSRWLETIQAAAEKGTYRMYKTVYATLAGQFYDRGLPREQKPIVDEAQAKQQIDIRKEDQIEAMKQIVNLIAVGPQISVVTRLISSFTDVAQCKLRRNEDLNDFVSCFRGLAADHLMHVGFSTSSQVREVLAITLLNNAMLSEETLTNAKLQLVSLVEARQRDHKEAEASITKSSHSSVLELLTKDTDLFSSPDVVPLSNDNAATVRRKANDLMNAGKDLLFQYSEVMDYLEKRSPEQNQVYDMFSTGPRCKLNLGDAVKVIRNLTFTPKKVEKSYSRADIDSIVGQGIQQAFAALQKRNEQGANSSAAPSSSGNASNYGPLQDASSRDNRPRRQRPDLSYCLGCGFKSNRRGSYDCKHPCHQTKAYKRRRKKAQKKESEKPKIRIFGEAPTSPNAVISNCGGRSLL